MLPEPATQGQVVLPDPPTVKPLVVPSTIEETLSPRGMINPLTQTGWEEITGSAAYMSFDGTGMRLERTAAGVAMLGIYRAIPYYPFTITMKCSWNLIGDYNYGPGIIVGGDVNSGAFAFGAVKWNDVLAMSRFASRTSWDSYYGEASSGAYVSRDSGYQQMYVEDSTTVEYRYSDNGLGFGRFWGGTVTDAVTHYGVGGYPADATTGWWGEVEWVHVA